MNNSHDHSLFQEIEADLQRQRYEALWKKYGMTVVSTAIAIVVVTAMVVGWRNYRLEQAHARTGGLADIVMQSDEKKPENYMAALLEYEKRHGASAQSAVARLYAGQAAVKENETAKALEIYAALADDKTVPAVYAQLAGLIYVLIDLDMGDAAKLEARLLPLMEKGVIWRPMALELAGHLALRVGDKDKAQKLFVELVNLEDAPPTVSQRASDMLLLIVQGKPK